MHGRLARLGAEAALGVIGEQTGHRDQREMSEQLLLDPALAAAVEVLHGQHLLENLIQFLDAPATVIQVGEGARRVGPGVRQGGGQRAAASARGVFHEAHATGPQQGVGQLRAGRGAGLDDDLVRAARGADEGAKGAVGVLLQAEDGLHAPRAVRVEQAEGVVAAVVDGDLAGREGGAPLVAE